MTSDEKWQRVKVIFKSALERSLADRAIYLREACGSDEAIRSEVESLLAEYDSNSDFLSKPAYQFMAGMLADEKPEFEPGRVLGPYKIVSMLGAGGMGEVYLAQDTRLGRKIALKLLPEDFVRDLPRVRRFEQEARSASSLNHPNVCVIHEIGKTEEGRHFIAMEYVDGVTLRQRLSEEIMTLSEVLNVSSQIATALAAAHTSGVIHRDIKPENVMIRSDGLIKILDFGLAKQTPPDILNGTQALTRVLVNTDPGLIMGTVAYISPEQARGLTVDARTDIWSLGVVLYEMVGGHLPFTGPTTSDTIVSILDREPPPLSFYKEDVPLELERIVRKALRKDREERYQVVKDLGLDLKSLRHDLQTRAEFERLRSSTDRSEAPAIISNDSIGMQNSQKALAPVTSSDKYLVRGINRHKLLPVIAILVSLTILGVVLYKLPSEKKESVPLNIKMTRLTTSGRADGAAISRDGNYVAWTVDDNGKRSLWVRQVASENALQLVSASDRSFWQPIFSPDGTQIYYSADTGPSTSGRDLYEVSVLGGKPKRVMDNVGVFSLSPDGKQIAFTTLEFTESALMTAHLDGSNLEKLTSRKFPSFISFPSWSPDSKTVAFVEWVVWGNVFNLSELSIKDKTERKLSSQNWSLINSVAWQSDGSALLVSAIAPSFAFFQVWRVAYPSGEAKQLISDLNQYSSLSVKGDSKSFVTVQSNEVSNLWVSSLNEGTNAKQITFGAGRHQDVYWQGDQSIVYTSNASGRADIWSMQRDGTDQRQLTNNTGNNYGPMATPDGKYIVFHSDRMGAWNLWRANSDGSNQKSLIKGEWASPSADGRSVVYVFEGKLWRISIDGGDPIQLTKDRTFSQAPSVSPKGDLIACSYTGVDNASSGVAIIPFNGGEPIKTLAVSLSGNIGPDYRWTPDAKGLIYVSTKNGVSNLWLQPLDGTRPKQLTDFKSDFIFSFDVSRQGKLLMSRGTITSDVVLISGLN